MFIYLAMIDSTDDREKFERVYLQYRYLMLHVAKQILPNHQDAEDAVHQPVNSRGLYHTKQNKCIKNRGGRWPPLLL